jgi:hypothetical protein
LRWLNLGFTLRGVKEETRKVALAVGLLVLLVATLVVTFWPLIYDTLATLFGATNRS